MDIIRTPPHVTIAIPTYNRAALLKEAIISALNQDYEKLQVLILDNASTDNTESVVKEFSDDRIVYLPSKQNVGMLNNWNRCIQSNSNPYLVILQDDDILLPTFVTEVVSKLEKCPNAGFGFSAIRFMDLNGTLGEHQDVSILPDEDIVDGLEYLHSAISPRGLLIHTSAVMFRATALQKIGEFDSFHDKGAFGYAMIIKLTSQFDVVAVHQELAHIRLHEGQITEQQWRSSFNTGPLGLFAERIDGIAYLLASPRAKKPEYREWLIQRLLRINAQQSSIAYSLLPQMYWSWQERLETSENEIISKIPDNEPLILIDDDQWGTDGNIVGRKTIPFSSKDGIYWGSPVNDRLAIEELNNHLQKGIKYVVIAWPAFWWLEHYTIFTTYLEEKAEKIYISSRIIIFRFNNDKIMEVEESSRVSDISFEI